MISSIVPTAGRTAATATSDPRATSSWYLDVSGRSDLKIEVESVWQDYNGEGVKVGVLDSQIDFKHVELVDAYDTSADFNFALGRGDISIQPRSMSDTHGTLVAGVIAAEGGNGIGSVGVAPGVTLVGLAIDYRSSKVLDQVVAALDAAVDLDVVNCSWSFGRNFSDNFNLSENALLSDSLYDLAATGRGGLGTTVVFSAGNSGIKGSSNYHNCQNSPYTIAVGAVSPNGDPWLSTSIGANILISAPGEKIISTSPNNRYSEVSGTSFAAPVVSAVVALMYEANPDLGYRDVQQILALSATTDGLSDEALAGVGWLTNGADNVNGGGMHYSDAFGYGIVNAHDAVRLAETWIVQQTSKNVETIVVEEKSNEVMVAGTDDRISFELEIDQMISVEHVQLSLDLSWVNTGDLDIYLTSPDGTKVQLVYDQGNTNYIGALKNFTFTSVASMGEMSVGTWTVDIYNRNPNAVDKNGIPISGSLDEATITLLGSSDVLDDLYIYTDEYSRLSGSEQSRKMLKDTDGGTDTLNATAVTSDTRIDLTGSRESTVAGSTLLIERNAGIENVFTGDGDDHLTGNAADNWFATGRGNDTLVYSSGSDTLAGGDGLDKLVINWVFSTTTYMIDQAENFMVGVLDLGYTVVREIETFVFLDVIYTLDDLIARMNDQDDPLPTPPRDDVVVIPTPDPPIPDVPAPPVTDSAPEPVKPVPITLIAFDRVLTGTHANDKLVGNSGTDDLIGGDGKDKLFGGAGDDRLEGGSGSDLLEGGAGADTFVFHISNIRQLDTIRDFNAAEGDTFQIVGLLPNASTEISFINRNGNVFLEMSTGDETFRLAKIAGTDVAALSFEQIDTDGFIALG